MDYRNLIFTAEWLIFKLKKAMNIVIINSYITYVSVTPKKNVRTRIARQKMICACDDTNQGVKD